MPKCPPIIPGQMAIGIQECNDDTDCNNGKICCSNGFGHECKDEVTGAFHLSVTGLQIRVHIQGRIYIYTITHMRITLPASIGSLATLFDFWKKKCN